MAKNESVELDKAKINYIMNESSLIKLRCLQSINYRRKIKSIIKGYTIKSTEKHYPPITLDTMRSSKRKKAYVTIMKQLKNYKDDKNYDLPVNELLNQLKEFR